MVLQFILEEPLPCTSFFNVHTAVEYFNNNISIGQLLQHISKSILICKRSRPKPLRKTLQEVFRLHNLLLIMIVIPLVKRTLRFLCVAYASVSFIGVSNLAC